MNTKITKLKEIALTAIKNSPIEILLSLLFFGLNMFLYFYSDFNHSALKELSYFYFAFFALAFAFNSMFSRRRIYYFLSILFPVLIYLYLLIGYDHLISLIITTISSVLLIFVAHNEKNNFIFTGKAIVTTLNILISGILAALSGLLLYSIIKSVNYILGINDDDDLIVHTIQYTSTYIILPLLFLVINLRNANVVKIDRFSEVLINYILTPSLFIYGIILYGYFTKVIILWELPKGVISITAILFLSIGIIVKASRELTDKKILNWFFKYIGYISIPALIMLWVGSSYRVWEYGFTENRIYLMISVVVLTIWNFAQMWNKTNVYHYLTIFTIVAFNIALYIPDKYDKKQNTDNEIVYDNTEIFYINTHNLLDIDIRGYDRIIAVDRKSDYSNNSYVVKNDTMFFNTKTDSLIAAISIVEMRDRIFKDAGIDYTKLNRKLVDEMENKPIIFKNDSIIVIIRGMLVKKRDNNVVLDDINIEQIVVK